MSREPSHRRRSRTLASLVISFVFAANILHAQETATATSPDSLADRLARAEEAIAALRQQIATQAEAGVQTKSGVRMELSGRVLMNVFTNTRRTNNFDVPYFVRERPIFGGPNGPSVGKGEQLAGGFSMRQTSIAAAIAVPDVMRGSFTGDIEADFFGGQMPSSGGRTFPLIRLRTARGIVRWTHTEVLIGQETILISPQNPISVASFGFPGFTGAGNLWLWLPQIRGSFEAGSGLRVALQGAVLAPTQGTPVGFFDTEPDSAELTRSPYGQARLRLAWGSEDTRGEIGVGVHRGRVSAGRPPQLNPPPARHYPSAATSVDVLIPISHWLDLRGEAYRGEGIRGLGTGAIGQNLGFDKRGVPRALRTTAGWAQINVHPRAAMSIGAGIGIDDPENDDRPLRRRNATLEEHFIWQFAGPLLFGAEVRQTTTDYSVNATNTNHHVNLAFGFVF